MYSTFSKFPTALQVNPAAPSIQPSDVLVGLRTNPTTGIVKDTQFSASSVAILPWSIITSAQSLVMNNGYFLLTSADTIFTLPTTPQFGQMLQLINATGAPYTLTIAQNAGQQISFGGVDTTVGIAGSIATVTFGDSITLLCNVTNTNFITLNAPQGNWIIT